MLAGAARSAGGDERLVRNFAAEAVYHFDDGRDYELVAWVFAAVQNHFFGAANAVGGVAHCFGAFGVADERRVRERALERKKFVRLVLRVRPAVAVPQNEVAAGLFDNPRAEVLVGAENYLPIFGNLFYDVEGVAACADYVAQLLYARAAINVGNHYRVRVLALEDGKLGGVAKLFEGAARGVVGEDDGLVGVEDFRGFRHEVYARERYDVGVGFLRLARESERVAHIVGYLLDFVAHIVVRQNYGVALFFELQNFFLYVRKLRFVAVFVGREDYCLHCLLLLKRGIIFFSGLRCQGS